MEEEVARRLLHAEHDRLSEVRRGLRAEHLDRETETESLDVLSPLDQHQADVGTEVFEREKDFSILARVDIDLRDVADAMARLDAGTYGTCQTCGAAIAADRLDAVPATRFCAEHEAMWEGDRLTLSVPAGEYPDGDARSAERIAVKEAGRHLEFLPEDDEIVAKLELGPEEAALHLTDPSRPDSEALGPEQVEALEERQAEWAEEERG